MVAITRSAAARQQQSPNTNNVVLPAGVSKVCGKKKKVAKQRAPSPNKASLSEIELSHHQNNYHVNAITNDAEQCLDFHTRCPNSDEKWTTKSPAKKILS
ncbi:unnamed protein product [Didymodactylos carnosus]|uniref:Uncharacterized protein n=1 Tax=Didymodactylos carnosus TaxID=1234261 RepID=A0A8S2FYM1_9BILA|nr:unnamed protein product [Didymodactylos carnosus]CAF4364534.1 unnamed protein product [Didymodactylos carnosus]